MNCNSQSGNSIIRYCSAALTTCNLHCAVVLLGISVMHRRFAIFTVENKLCGVAVWNWWTAICTVQDVLYASRLQHGLLAICTVEIILSIAVFALCKLGYELFHCNTNDYQIAIWKLYYEPLMCRTLKFPGKKYINCLSLFIQEFTHFNDMAKYKWYWRIRIVTRATVFWCFQADQVDCCYE